MSEIDEKIKRILNHRWVVGTTGHIEDIKRSLNRHIKQDGCYLFIPNDGLEVVEDFKSLIESEKKPLEDEIERLQGKSTYAFSRNVEHYLKQLENWVELLKIATKKDGQGLVRIHEGINATLQCLQKCNTTVIPEYVSPTINNLAGENKKLEEEKRQVVREIFEGLNQILEMNDNELLEMYPDDFNELKQKYLGEDK